MFLALILLALQLPEPPEAPTLTGELVRVERPDGWNRRRETAILYEVHARGGRERRISYGAQRIGHPFNETSVAAERCPTAAMIMADKEWIHRAQPRFLMEDGAVVITPDGWRYSARGSGSYAGILDGAKPPFIEASAVGDFVYQIFSALERCDIVTK